MAGMARNSKTVRGGVRPNLAGARGGVISAEALHLVDFFLLLRWGSAGRCSADEVVEEEDAGGSGLAAKFVKFVVGGAMVNNRFLVQNASPAPWGICSQEGQLAMGVGAGLGELVRLSLLMAEVSRHWRPPWSKRRNKIGGLMVKVVCVRFGGKVEG